MDCSPHEQLAEMERKVQACEDSMRMLLARQDAHSAHITHMLHNNVAQYVAALQLGLVGLERVLNTGAEVRPTLQSLHALSQSVGEELHKVVLELRPTSLDDYGLVRSLTAFLDEWSLNAKTAVDFDHVAFGEGRLPRPLETNLFRIIRDMLDVVSRHSQVSQVSVVLGRHLDSVVSVVEHNGHPPEGRSDPETTAALASVQARVALLQGSFTVEDCAKSGRTMIARVPGKRTV